MAKLRYILLAGNSIFLVLTLYSFAETYSRIGTLPAPRWAPISIVLILVFNLIYLWMSRPPHSATHSTI